MVAAFGFHIDAFLLGIHCEWLGVYFTIIEKWIKFLKVSILADCPVIIIPKPMVVIQLPFLLYLIRTFDQVS